MISLKDLGELFPPSKRSLSWTIQRLAAELRMLMLVLEQRQETRTSEWRLARLLWRAWQADVPGAGRGLHTFMAVLSRG